MIRFQEKFPGASGIIGEFLNPADPRKARDQINEAYAHGGGWNEFQGFTLSLNAEAPNRSFLKYPDDPNMLCKAFAFFRDEIVLVFDYDWCAIVSPDNSYTIARLD